MADWLSYTLSDFLMFGPEVYWRLFALQNQAFWPLPLIALVAGCLTLGLAAAGRIRLAMFLVALGWAGATHFLSARYAPVNWPAGYAALAFGLQAALLAGAALSGGVKSRRPVTGPDHWIGLGLLAYALLVHAFVGLGFGHPLSQAEIAGLAPDPTALATLGLLLLAGPGARADALAIIPLLWCLASSATLLTLGASQGWILIAGSALWAAGRASQSLAGRRQP